MSPRKECMRILLSARAQKLSKVFHVTDLGDGGDDGEVRPVSCPRDPNSSRAQLRVPPPLPGFTSSMEVKEACSPSTPARRFSQGMPLAWGPLLPREKAVPEVAPLHSDDDPLDGAALLVRAAPQEDITSSPLSPASVDKAFGGASVQVTRSGKENMPCPASEGTPRAHRPRKAPVPSQEMANVTAMRAQIGALQERLHLAESEREGLQSRQREMEVVAEMNHADLASQRSRVAQLQACLAESKLESEAMEVRLEQAAVLALRREESMQAQHDDIQALQARLQYLEAEALLKARDAVSESERSERLCGELQAMEVTASLRNEALSSMGAQLGAMQESFARVEAEEAALQELWHNSEAACAEAQEQLVCIVCLDCPRDTLLDPCLHFGLCSSCARTVERCPVCRARIRVRHRIVSV